MTHATVCIIMDAGRADHVRPDTMPFLHGLANQGMRGMLDRPPGTTRPVSLYSGRYPDTANDFGPVVFDPDGRPHPRARHLGPAINTMRPQTGGAPARRVVNWYTQRRRRGGLVEPAGLPPEFLPFLRPTNAATRVDAPNALGAPSIFDVCREQGRSFRYLAQPQAGNDDDIHRALVRALRNGAAYDLYVGHFRGMQAAHGTSDAARPEAILRDLDQKIAGIHAALTAGYDDWDLVVCGDHGVGPVRQRIDIMRALGATGAEPGRDYVVFIDSTIAAFWYLSDKGRRAIEAVLPNVPGARIVDEAERKARRIPTGPRWGHRMLAAQPGVAFSPDHVHVAGQRVADTPAYLDPQDDARGIAVVASNNGHTPVGELGVRPLVDVFPTLCDLIGVPAPKTHEGKSMLPGS